MKRLSSIFIFTILVSSLLHANSRTKKPIVVKVFEDTHISFNPTIYKDGLTEKDGNLFLSNGRVAIKKISIPKFINHTDISIKISLVSNGDRWDKTGSCFVIPNNSKTNIIDIAKKISDYPKQDKSKYEELNGIVAGENYLPNVELMRFMTPFGVGHYSNNNDSVSSARRPVYVDGWAENVEWHEDISDLAGLLEDEVYIGVFIDTWTEEGYKIDASLTFTESNVKNDVKISSNVLPLINTVYYYNQKHPDIFSRKDVEIPFILPENAKNVKLKYITTGHGGHSGGDEFRAQKNILYINEIEVFNEEPWRTDCASFRRFNPTSGVWLVKKSVAFIAKDGTRQVKEIEEPLASSDLSRSNWCPGSNVPPFEIIIPSLNKGLNTLKISIPNSNPIENEKLNHWLVSAYLVWDLQ